MSDIAKMIAIAKRFGGGSGPTEVVILPETETKYEAAYEGFPIRTEPNAKPEAGAVCLVTFNGKAYDCPAVVIPEGMGLTGFLFGNSDAMGIPGGNTSAPFVVILYDSPLDDKGDGDFTHGLVASMEELAEGAVLTLSIVQVGAASGGDGGAKVVTITADGTVDGSNITIENLSGTLAGITAAAKAGSIVRMVFHENRNNGNYILPLVMYGENIMAQFCATVSGTIAYEVTVTADGATGKIA